MTAEVSLYVKFSGEERNPVSDFVRMIMLWLFWARSLVVSDFRSEIKGSQFESGC